VAVATVSGSTNSALAASLLHVVIAVSSASVRRSTGEVIRAGDRVWLEPRAFHEFTMLSVGEPTR